MKLILLLILLAANVFTIAQATQLKTILTGFDKPTEIKFFPSSNNYALIAEKEGDLNFVNLDTKKHYVIHTLAVDSAVEKGLLGVDFHPQFNKKPYLFINYNPAEGEQRTRVSRFNLTLNTDQRYQLTHEKIIIEIDQPYPNHNGGQVAFGPDGYLYIGMGDGGSGGDPEGHGQNTQTLLGNMLRIDINTPQDTPYAIPKDNPFVGKAGFRPEIWAYGVRNPWRFSFAGETLIVADVGQSKSEEVSVVKKGQNLGWNIMEGNHCFKPKKACDQTALTLPKLTYGRDDGLSITGGYVYKGKLIPELYNHYIYADFILGGVWSSAFPALNSSTKLFTATGINLSTFALDAKGEIYSADYASGDIYQFVP
ncbi:PQQ-dependent sugar dehydrogenase [Algibacillus agarilyticus]|uniref:PQQ-dependent sugar dehydrogenase n=1 Tax=Algibacillus agarilyticus TaxID=2234133 RepID=UPI000DD01163|nr:PQQ-dependent sugar dehydrogenase [Algibacillus agarilyticus]